MPSALSLTFYDYGGEKSTVRLEGATYASDGTDFVAIDGQQETLASAIEAVSLGDVVRRVQSQAEVNTPPTPQTDPYSQRETKWLVKATENTTGRALRWEIPCADLSLLDANAPGQMDKSDAAYIALKAALEAYVLTPAGYSVTVGDIIHVGRNI